MLTKERKRVDNFTSSLSPEGWAALKMSNIAGTTDKDLAEVYEVTEMAIRKKRSKDKGWAVAIGLKNRYLGKRGLKSKHLDSVAPITKRHQAAEKASVEVLHATFADESKAAQLLALQIAQKGLKASLHGDGSLKEHLSPTEPSHVKIYADVAAKAGGWGTESQVTVNCQAFAGVSAVSRNSENEDTIIDV